MLVLKWGFQAGEVIQIVSAGNRTYKSLVQTPAWQKAREHTAAVLPFKKGCLGYVWQAAAVVEVETVGGLQLTHLFNLYVLICLKGIPQATPLKPLAWLRHATQHFARGGLLGGFLALYPAVTTPTPHLPGILLCSTSVAVQVLHMFVALGVRLLLLGSGSWFASLLRQMRFSLCGCVQFQDWKHPH